MQRPHQLLKRSMIKPVRIHPSTQGESHCFSFYEICKRGKEMPRMVHRNSWNAAKERNYIGINNFKYMCSIWEQEDSIKIDQTLLTGSHLFTPFQVTLSELVRWTRKIELCTNCAEISLLQKARKTLMHKLSTKLSKNYGILYTQNLTAHDASLKK